MNALALPRRRSVSIVEGEYELTQRNFQHIATILRAHSGIFLAEAKATLVYSRLAKRLRKLGLRSFDEYCVFIDAEEGAEERSQMLAALTTNVTRFFREPHHFDHLRDHVLPPLLDAARDGARVRIWSSACSSGEEPYSIALTLLDLFPEAGRYDVRILATDIDPNVVNTARAGIYRGDAVAPVAPRLRDRWMSKVRDQENSWRLKDDVRQLISFKELNLIGDWPMRGQFDAIFCRNVVIYFEEETQALIWKRLGERLTPTGRLYIGHSERVNIPGFVSDGLTVYKLDRGAAR